MASRENCLYIISVLKEHSDESHPLSLKEIELEIRNTHFQNHPEESPNNSTIRRILAELVGNIYEAAGSIDVGIPDPLHLGFCIGCYIKNTDGSFVPYIPNQGDGSSSNREDYKGKPRTKSPTLYYYYKNAFDDSEIELMISALEAHNYLSAEDIADLVTKLAGLSHGLSELKGKKYNNIPDPRIDNFQAYTLDHLNTLHTVIQKKQFARIQNCYYNEKHQLIPLPNNPKIVRPIRLMFNNGYYYLIAVEYSSTKENYFTVHYRIDRIGDIDPFEPSPEQRKAYCYEQPEDPAAYRLKHPVMYGDDLIDVRMLVKRSPFMLNTLTDFFGSNARIRNATVAELQQLPLQFSDTPEEWLHVAVKASKGGMALFATEYCVHVCVLSPKDLKDRITTDLKTGLAMYE